MKKRLYDTQETIHFRSRKSGPAHQRQKVIEVNFLRFVADRKPLAASMGRLSAITKSGENLCNVWRVMTTLIKLDRILRVCILR